MANFIYPVEEKVESNERVKHASLAAEAAERRLSLSKPSSNVKLDLLQFFSHHFLLRKTSQMNKERFQLFEHDLNGKLNEFSPQEDEFVVDLSAANDEKLELLEENRLSMEKFKVTLTSEKEREERTLRDQMKADLK